VWHQTGSQQQVQVEEAYRQAGVTARVSEFTQDMGEAYAWADVVIARAGALTVTELQQVARPALFIPFPHAVDDHQYTNSLALVKLGAAEVLRQSEASVEVLRERLSDYVYNPKSLSHCYAHLNAQLENTAAEQVAQVLIDLIMALPSHNKKEQQEV